MRLSTGWWGIGLGDYRGSGHTYELYDAESLPPLEVPEGYAWLDGARLRGAPMKAVKIPDDVPLGLPFEEFFGRAELQGAFSSPTDCYWDVAVSFTPEAFGPEARLVRFLADSQGCLFWYLLTRPGGPWPVLCGFAEEYDLVQVAGSFDEFLRRFWIENAAWWEAVDGDGEPSAAVRDYLAHYGG